MIRRIRQFYPGPTEIARDRGQFAGRWPSTIAETRPRTGYRTPPYRSLLCHHLVADKVSRSSGWQGDRRDEDLHGSRGDAGVDRNARARPDGRQAPSRRRKEDGAEEAGSGRQGLQGGARKNTRTQGKV